MDNVTIQWSPVFQMRMSDSADPVLIEAAINGSEPAFAELVRRYQSAVWGTVHRTLGNSSEGEDAVQEVFLRALVSLPRFDRRLPFGPWILRIASNYCIDQLRRRKTRKYKLWSDLSEAEVERTVNRMSYKPDAEGLAAEDPAKYVEVARSLLDRLKPRRRMAFVLREIEGHSYAAVAKILRVPEVTARVRVWRARADLHQEFCRYLAKLEGGTRNEKTL
jgi:RNA polymerase sigma-70 factor (ECF subfamily)